MRYLKKKHPIFFEMYNMGGGYCTRCCILYTFMDLYKLLLEHREKGDTHQIPKCVDCHRAIRTTPRKAGTSGKFWEWVEFLESRNTS